MTNTAELVQTIKKEMKGDLWKLLLEEIENRIYDADTNIHNAKNFEEYKYSLGRFDALEEIKSLPLSIIEGERMAEAEKLKLAKEA